MGARWRLINVNSKSCWCSCFVSQACLLERPRMCRKPQSRPAKLMWKDKGFWAQKGSFVPFLDGGVLWCRSVFTGKVRSWQKLMLCLETFTEVGRFDGQGFNIERYWHILKYHDILYIYISINIHKYIISRQAMSNWCLTRRFAQTLI